jgi:hypothetical protein
MRKILKGSLLLLLISGCFIFLLEYRYKNYRTYYDIIFKDIEKNKDQYTDIYIGNSHSQALKTYTNKPNAVVLNIATPGQDVFKTYTILKKWLPQFKNVRTVYFGLDHETLGQNLSLSGLKIDDRQLYKYTDTLYDNSIENQLMAKSGFFRANRDISYLYKPQPSIEEVTYVPPTVNLNDADCKRRSLEHSQIRFKQFLIDENLKLLNKIIEVANANKVKLVVFNPPKSDCYNNNLYLTNSNLAKQKIDSLFTAGNINYININDSNYFSKADFLDYDHLNEVGRQKFIKLLNKKVFNIITE